MSRKTYKDLMTDIRFYLNRTDEDTLSRIPSWVHMAQDTLDRILRHPAAETVVTFPVRKGEDNIPIPANLLELKSLRIKETGAVLYRRTLETLYDVPLHSDYPTGYSRKANQYILNKPAIEELEVEIIFYTAPKKLSSPTDINLYTQQCYDMMLYYALSEGFSYLLNGEESQLYNQKASQSYEMLMDSIRKEEYSGSTLVYFGDNDILNEFY